MIVLLQLLAFLVLTAFAYSIIEGAMEGNINRVFLSLILTLGMAIVMVHFLGARLADNINWGFTAIWAGSMFFFYFLGEKMENKLVETMCLVCCIGLFVCLF